MRHPVILLAVIIGGALTIGAVDCLVGFTFVEFWKFQVNQVITTMYGAAIYAVMTRR